MSWKQGKRSQGRGEQANWGKTSSTRHPRGGGEDPRRREGRVLEMVAAVVEEMVVAPQVRSLSSRQPC
jgi:hypothetical protein